MAVQVKAERSINDWSYARIGYENKLTSTTTSAAEPVLIPNTWERWEDASGTMQAVFQLGTAGTVNFVGVAAHNLFTAGATSLRVEVSDDSGSSYDTVEEITPASNNSIYLMFDDYLNITNVRVTVNGGTNREIGVVYAGESLVMQRALFGGHTPINLASKTEYRNSMSDSGQFLGRRIKRKGQQSSFSWSNMTDQWYRDNFQPFVNAAKTKPFFIAWRPDYHNSESAFGYTTSDITPQNQGGGVRLMSVTVSMRAHDE